MRQPEALAAQPHITIATAGQEQGLAVGDIEMLDLSVVHEPDSSSRALMRQPEALAAQPHITIATAGQEQGLSGRIPSVASSARTEGPGGAFVVSRAARAADGIRPDSPPGSPLTDAVRDRGSPRCGPGSRTACRCSRPYGERRSASPGCQYAIADLLGAALVPELRADVAARTASDVQRLLVAVAAMRALPHQLAVVLGCRNAGTPTPTCRRPPQS